MTRPPLAVAHDRTAFGSGSEPLDNYFRLQVSQDIRRRVSACFVALTPDLRITSRLKDDALALVEIRVLDHLIVSIDGSVSLAERGLI